MTDKTGRFLLRVPALAPGHHELRIDGATTSTPGKKYGLFEYGMTVKTAETNVLPFTIWMPRLDLDNLVREARQTGAWLIAFYPHVNVELRRAGERAGVERVYPRSRFLRDLPNLLLERLEKRR